MFFDNSKEKIVKKQSKKGKILKSVNKATKVASFRKEKYLKESTFRTLLEDCYIYFLQDMANYPKVFRWVIGQDIKDSLNELINLTIKVSRMDKKHTTLRDMDIALEKLKFYLFLINKKGNLSNGKYAMWLDKLNMVGSIIGHQIKNNPKTAKDLES